MHFLITQLHEEDNTLQNDIVEAETWQAALGMVGLGWAVEQGGITKEDALNSCKAEGTWVMIGLVEAYNDYKGVTKIQLKEVS